MLKEQIMKAKGFEILTVIEKEALKISDAKEF